MIDFTSAGHGEKYLVSGFSGAEDKRRWTNGPYAVQEIVLNDDHSKNLQVDIMLESVFNGQQTVTVFFNDHFVHHTIQKDKQLSFIVDKSFLKEGKQILAII